MRWVGFAFVLVGVLVLSSTARTEAMFVLESENCEQVRTWTYDDQVHYVCERRTATSCELFVTRGSSPSLFAHRGCSQEDLLEVALRVSAARAPICKFLWYWDLPLARHPVCRLFDLRPFYRDYRYR